MNKMHTHPCAKCKTLVECDGTYSRNHDGWPAAICDAYHESVGPAAWLCLSCAMQEQARYEADLAENIED
jgi:hypothetical protein